MSFIEQINERHIQSQIRLEHFFPVYPEIDVPLKNQYYDSQSFNTVIYAKDEFYKNKLEQSESVKEGETFLTHQKLLANYMSSNTPYNGLLIMHETGTGKTSTAISIIEKIKSENSTINGAIILTKGEGLHRNFINELLERVPSSYKPIDYDKLSIEKRKKAVKKLVSEFYTFETFIKFSNRLDEIKDPKDYQKYYSNKIIVIDEVHNLRIQDKQSKYDTIHKFLHNLENSKIILMSGTPMKDNVSEIASVMNLILPLDNQFELGERFNKMAFQGNSNKLQQSYELEFIEKIKGRISYLRAMPSSVTKTFVINPNNNVNLNLKQIVTYNIELSELQAKFLKPLCASLDKQIDEVQLLLGKDSAFSKNVRQGSMFVFPNGNIIDNEYVLQNKEFTQAFRVELNRNVKPSMSYDERVRTIIQNVKKYSTKYAFVLEKVYKSLTNVDVKKNKLCFVYSKLVEGCGLILLSLLFKEIGFADANSKLKLDNTNKRLRYAILTGVTTTPNLMVDIINTFNDSRNKFGEFVGVILGSNVISEGYTLKNVQVEVILQPHWNYAENEQALARGIRYGSHNDLLVSGIVPDVEIYQLCSVFKDNTPESIEARMYTICETKLDRISVVEHIIKENAFDCQLTFARNRLSDSNYKCKDVNVSVDRDFNTYNVFYKHYYIKVHSKTLLQFFSEHFAADLLSILNYCVAIYGIRKLKQLPIYQILETLHYMIGNMIPVPNKYGIVCYLYNRGDLFFLHERLNMPPTISNAFYTQYPVLQKDTNYETVFLNTMNKFTGEQFVISLLSDIINIEKDIDLDIDSIRTISNILDVEEKSILLETTQLYFSTNTGNLEKLQKVLDYYKGNIEFKVIEIDGIERDCYVNTLLYNNKRGPLRTFDTVEKVWTNSSEIVEIDYVEVIDSIQSNSYGLYGVYNVDLNAFCISTISKRKFNISLDKKLLSYYAALLGIEPKDVAISTLTQQEILKSKKIKLTKPELIEKIDLTKLALNKLRLYFTWLTISSNKQDKTLVNALQDFISNIREETLDENVLDILNEFSEKAPSKGRNIETIDTVYLCYYAAIIEAIEVPSNFDFESKSNEDLIAFILNRKTKLSVQDLNLLNVNQLRCLYYIYVKQLDDKKLLSNNIKKKLKELNLVIYNFTCGV